MEHLYEIKISVVIPLFNKEKSIRSTVESVLNQTFKSFELIIVNDGSTDSSLDVINSIVDYRIKIINKTIGGVSSARNAGIKASLNEYVALLDADDLWGCTFLEDMCNLISNYPDAALFGSSYFIIDSEGNKKDIINGLPDNYAGYITNYFRVAIKNPLYSSSCTILKRSASYKIGLFDENLARGEDLDMWIKFAINEKIAYYNKPLACYRWGTENRVMHQKCEKNKCLIWNLSRYSEFEKSNNDFKYYIDNWRIAHINNYLSGNRQEIDEIETLLNEIDLKKFSFFYTIIKILPNNLRVFAYRIKRIMSIKRVKRIFKRQIS